MLEGRAIAADLDALEISGWQADLSTVMRNNPRKKSIRFFAWSNWSLELPQSLLWVEFGADGEQLKPGVDSSAQNWLTCEPIEDNVFNMSSKCLSLFLSALGRWNTKLMHKMMDFNQAYYLHLRTILKRYRLSKNEWVWQWKCNLGLPNPSRTRRKPTENELNAHSLGSLLGESARKNFVRKSTPGARKGALIWSGWRGCKFRACWRACRIFEYD